MENPHGWEGEQAACQAHRIEMPYSKTVLGKRERIAGSQQHTSQAGSLLAAAAFGEADGKSRVSTTCWEGQGSRLSGSPLPAHGCWSCLDLERVFSQKFALLSPTCSGWKFGFPAASACKELTLWLLACLQSGSATLGQDRLAAGKCAGG